MTPAIRKKGGEEGIGFLFSFQQEHTHALLGSSLDWTVGMVGTVYPISLGHHSLLLGADAKWGVTLRAEPPVEVRELGLLVFFLLQNMLNQSCVCQHSKLRERQEAVSIFTTITVLQYCTCSLGIFSACLTRTDTFSIARINHPSSFSPNPSVKPSSVTTALQQTVT